MTVKALLILNFRLFRHFSFVSYALSISLNAGTTKTDAVNKFEILDLLRIGLSTNPKSNI